MYVLLCYVLHSVNICFVLVPISGITSHFAYSIFLPLSVVSMTYPLLVLTITPATFVDC